MPEIFEIPGLGKVEGEDVAVENTGEAIGIARLADGTEIKFSAKIARAVRLAHKNADGAPNFIFNFAVHIISAESKPQTKKADNSEE